MEHADRAATRTRIPREHGFTLIEILVVLVIIGVALTFATLSIDPSGPADRLDEEAQRLLALSQTAADEAILSGHTLGLEQIRGGYRFVKLNEAGWQVIQSADDALHPRRLPEDVYLDRLDAGGQQDDGQATRQSATLTLPPSPVPPTPEQAKAQAEQRARQDDEALPIPAALFLSSGELLPFRLELSARDVDHRFDIVGDPNGDIVMQRIDR